MSFHKPTRHELAAHECGHAYAFAALVRYEEPKAIGLARDEHGNMHGWCRRSTLLHKEVPLDSVRADALPSIEWQAAAETVIALAGPFAEFRHRHRSRDAAALIIHQNADRFLRTDAFDVDGDFARIRATMSYIRPSDALFGLKALGDITDQIVAANWSSIRRLARRLLERDRLDGDELAAWFEAHSRQAPCRPPEPEDIGANLSMPRPQRHVRRRSDPAWADRLYAEPKPC